MPVRKILLAMLPIVILKVTTSIGGDSLELKKSTLLYKGNLKSYGLEINDALKVQDEKDTKARFQKLRYSGYSRLWMIYRDLDKAYDDVPLEGMSVPITLTQDDGANEPLLLIRMEANPTPKTWFQMEWSFDNRFLRSTTQTDAKGYFAKVYRIFQFKGTTYSNFGTFKLTAGGGVNWFKLSPFTMWNYQYRDDMFERYPWEPEGHDFGRYDAFYSLGDIPRDQRWGNRGTQGFILEAEGLPGGFNAAILYGKNENSGGFQSYLERVPQNMLSGRVDKRIGAHTFGVNYFDQYGYDENYANRQVWTVGGEDYKIEQNRTSQKIITADGRVNLNGVKIFTELGAGSYLSNSYIHEDTITSGAVKYSEDTTAFTRFKREWSALGYLEFEFSKDLTKLPIKLGLYSIGKGAVNNTSTIFNTSIESIKQGPTQPQSNNTTYFDGMVNQIGQLPNNRRGFNLKTHGKVSKLKYEVAYETSQEIENLYGDTRNGARAGTGASDAARTGYTNSITFHHWANQLARSRFAYFQRFAGNTGREHNVYRRSFTNLAITDTAVDYKKSFTTIDLTMKYKLRFLKKEMILAMFGQYSSVSEDMFAPKLNDDAFLRYRYVELMAFYALHPKLTVIGFGAVEGAKGNMRTELADPTTGQLITDANGAPTYDANGKPMDQSGYGFGIGCDYNFANRASLHYRHRWYAHSDVNFTDDEFEGQEVTIELKVFF